MTNPPAEQTKMVKIKAIYPIRVPKVVKGKEIEEIVSPGQTAEVSEEDAREFCDRKFNIGMKEHFGPLERRAARRTMVTRAERVK